MYIISFIRLKDRNNDNFIMLAAPTTFYICICRYMTVIQKLWEKLHRKFGKNSRKNNTAIEMHIKRFLRHEYVTLYLYSLLNNV